MRFYKLRVTTNAATTASQFNEQFKPETIPEANDPFRVDWITTPSDEAYVVGDAVCSSSAPNLFSDDAHYALRHSVYRIQPNWAMCSDGHYTVATSIPVITIPMKRFWATSRQ